MDRRLENMQIIWCPAARRPSEISCNWRGTQQQVVKRYFHLAFFNESVLATGNRELATHARLSPLTLMVAMSTCALQRHKNNGQIFVMHGCAESSIDVGPK